MRLIEEGLTEPGVLGGGLRIQLTREGARYCVSSKWQVFYEGYAPFKAREVFEGVLEGRFPWT